MDKEYANQVRARIESLGLTGRVELAGNVPYREIPRRYASASVVVNSSHTGSVDKVVLEAMASRRPVVSCNESIPPVLASLGARADALHFEKGDARDLADKVEALLDLDVAARDRLGEDLRAIVARDHDVDRLMARLVREMGGVA